VPLLASRRRSPAPRPPSSTQSQTESPTADGLPHPRRFGPAQRWSRPLRVAYSRPPVPRRAALERERRVGSAALIHVEPISYRITQSSENSLIFRSETRQTQSRDFACCKERKNGHGLP
jgi:hypothetical protein